FSKNDEKLSGQVFPHWVLWMTPILSRGGYSSEASSYVAALDASKSISRLRILQHGDLEILPFWNGFPNDMKSLAMKLYGGDVQLNTTVVILHNEPGTRYPPQFEITSYLPNGYD
ncbi:hypothetical protein KI387_026152, partial [Taxus chinensis]